MSTNIRVIFSDAVTIFKDKTSDRTVLTLAKSV